MRSLPTRAFQAKTTFKRQMKRIPEAKHSHDKRARLGTATCTGKPAPESNHNRSTKTSRSNNPKVKDSPSGYLIRFGSQPHQQPMLLPLQSAINAMGKRKLCTILFVILSTSPILNNAFTTSDTDSIAGPVITSRIRLTTPIAER